jgi:cytochrome b561
MRPPRSRECNLRELSFTDADLRRRTLVTSPIVAAACRYDGAAMIFHWLSAVLVLALIAIGFVMTRLTAGGADQFTLYQFHKSLGFMLLLLTTLRVVWRATRQSPPWPFGALHRGRAAARLLHGVLYVCLFVVPLAGWALVSASTLNIPTTLFGLVTLPHLPILSDLASPSRARVEPVLSRVHAILAYVLAGLVLLHSSAAIWHGRPVLARMVPRWQWRRD